MESHVLTKGSAKWWYRNPATFKQQPVSLMHSKCSQELFPAILWQIIAFLTHLACKQQENKEQWNILRLLRSIGPKRFQWGQGQIRHIKIYKHTYVFIVKTIHLTLTKFMSQTCFLFCVYNTWNKVGKRVVVFFFCFFFLVRHQILFISFRLLLLAFITGYLQSLWVCLWAKQSGTSIPSLVPSFDPFSRCFEHA